MTTGSTSDVILGLEELRQMETPRGGYTRVTLAALGVQWPPSHKWRRGLIGTRISRELFEKLARRRGRRRRPACSKESAREREQ